MRWFLIFGCLLIMICRPATALEVFHCSDTNAIGYQWRDGKPTATRYIPVNFIVKIISDTERIIDSPSMDYNDSKYSCRMLASPTGVLACARPGSITGYPINFSEDRFERVGNLSAQIGGTADLYVAYGRCEPF